MYLPSLQPAHLCAKRLYFAAISKSQLPSSSPTTATALFSSLSQNWTYRQDEITTVSDHIRERVQKGELIADDTQKRAARRLSRLQYVLVGYDDHSIENECSRTKEEEEAKSCTASDSTRTKEGAEVNQKLLVPRGVYLHGNVGIGKSMLMDTFYEKAPIQKKRRVHFHSFLQEIHTRIHSLKKNDLNQHGRNFHIDTTLERNPIFRVAMDVSHEVKLLCFDEFQVTDVADAMILSHLFSVLFRRGTVMVATSNRPPSDLYEGGLNRGYFLPFIDLVKKHCIVHPMTSTLDYRWSLAHGDDGGGHFCFVYDGMGDLMAVTQRIDEIFHALSGTALTSAPITIDTAFQRQITVNTASPDGATVCRFHFHDLCCKELSSSDYRAIAQRFDIVIIESVPQLTLVQHNQARRFITLIDELYEAQCALAISSQCPPESLFFDHSNNYDGTDTSLDSNLQTKVGENFGIDVPLNDGKTIGEFASIRELSFAFRRAASRLVEMTSKDWWQKYSFCDDDISAY